MAKLRTLAAGGTVVAVAAGVWYAAAASPRASDPAAPDVTTTSAPLTRGDVIQRVQVAGTLNYGTPHGVPSQLPAGILTGAAGPGSVVARGGQLFSVAGTPAILLYGPSPAYRDFTSGMTDGSDVRQLEENLVALGAARRSALRVDDHFGPATAAAIRRWQKSRGLPAARRTGVLRLGEVVFQPGPVRVSQTTAAVGSSVGPGTAILSATSTTRVVGVRINTDQQQLVHIGDAVQVSLPTGEPVTGTVGAIGRVAEREGNAAGGGEAQPTIPVTVSLRVPSGDSDLDQAPVQVSITTEQHRGVLLVPVSALLAKPGGGYQVRQYGDGTLVDVQPGLFDDDAGTVEVTGPGLAEGQLVEVPLT
jgi:peptidoglycan hydrolase-like protein with peptidoglycan-binding domain